MLTSFTLQASSLAAEHFQLPRAAVKAVEGFVQVFVKSHASQLPDIMH